MEMNKLFSKHDFNISSFLSEFYESFVKKDGFILNRDNPVFKIFAEILNNHDIAIEIIDRELNIVYSNNLDKIAVTKNNRSVLLNKKFNNNIYNLDFTIRELFYKNEITVSDFFYFNKKKNRIRLNAFSVPAEFDSELALINIFEKNKVSYETNINSETSITRLYKNLSNFKYPVIIIQNDKILFSNKIFKRILNLNDRSFRTMYFWEIASDKYQKLFKFRELKRQNGFYPDNSYELILKDNTGKTIFTEFNSTLIELNNQPAVIGLILEKSEHKKIENKILKSENELRTFFENNEEAILWVNAETQLIENCNSTFLKLLDMRREDIINKNCLDLHTKNKRDYYSKMFQSHVKNISKSGIVEFVNSRGEKIDLKTKTKIFKFEDRTILQGIFEDITTRKIIDEKLQINRKFNFLEILTDGITQDFNRIFEKLDSEINSFLQMDLSVKVKKHLLKILKTNNRAKLLNQQLSYFSSSNDFKMEVHNIRDIIENSAFFTFNNTDVKFEIDTNDLSEDDFLHNINISLMSQFFYNIFHNSSISMDGSGKVFVNISNHKIENKNTEKLHQNSYLKISIRDSGCGIRNENIGKIFDPYFSTRDLNSGLGLTICKSIIKKHNGFILVDSKLNVGTCFNIFLPKIHKKDLLKRDREKILILDDESMVLEITSEIIRELGYTPIPSKTIEETVKIYKDHLEANDRIKLVICDINLQKNNDCLVFLNKIKKIDTNPRIIVSSGHYNNKIMMNWKDYGFSGAINKPYNIDVIEKLLEENLI